MNINKCDTIYKLKDEKTKEYNEDIEEEEESELLSSDNLSYLQYFNID